LVVVLILIVHQKNHVLMEIVLTRVLTLIVVSTHFVELMGTTELDVIALQHMKEIRLQNVEDLNAWSIRTVRQH
jgi:hypothetical protein